MPKSTTLLARALLLGLALLTLPAARAQINYQGRLTDAAGAPLADGQYSIEFSLWDAATAGTQLWGPYVTDGAAGSGHGPRAALVDSRFNVVIGAADTAGRSLTAALASATNTYLQIKVGASAPISPRQIILAAPRALTADVLPNVVPNATGVTLSGSVVVQGDAAAGTNQVVIQGQSDPTQQLLLSYHSASNYGAIQTRQSATATNLVLNPAGGRVGIGKADPQSALDVNGEIRAPSINGELAPYVIEVGHKEDVVNYHAVEVPSEIIEQYLGDADGGTIRFLMRIVGSDYVRIVDEQFYFEQMDKSVNGLTNGLQGASQIGTASRNFTLNTTTAQELVPPINTDWVWMKNYSTRGLTGLPAGANGVPFTGTNMYRVEFLTAPNISATIIIYDR